MKSSRPEKVASEFKKAIYGIITRKLKNPLITEMVSITEVEVSSDMSHADVFVSIYSTDAERKNRTFKEISASAKKLNESPPTSLTDSIIVFSSPERNSSSEITSRTTTFGTLNVSFSTLSVFSPAFMLSC